MLIRTTVIHYVSEILQAGNISDRKLMGVRDLEGDLVENSIVIVAGVQFDLLTFVVLSRRLRYWYEN